MTKRQAPKRVKAAKQPGVFSRDGGDTWEYRAQFADSHGRWSASGSGYRTQKEAVTARADAIKETRGLRGRQARLSPSVTVNDYLPVWLEEHGATVRLSSAVAYRSHCRALSRLPIGALQVRSVTDSDVKRLIGQLREAGVGHETLVARVRVLHGAIRHGLVTSNPATGIRIARTTERYRAAVWSAEEALAFLRHRQAAGDPLYALWRLAVTTGMRKGELLGLRWEDIDLVAGTLQVRRQRTYVSGGVVEGPPKTASSEAPVTLDKATVAALEALEVRPHGYCFSNPVTGRPWASNSGFDRLWHGACKAAGVPVIRFHGLRHTAATLLAELGVPLRVVQERLRHWSPQMTERYTHAQAGAAKAAADAMGDLLAS
jgi:integrase